MKTSRWPRLKKWLKRLLFALVTFITLAALGLAIEGHRAKRAWDTCQRELADRGESLNWQTHVASPVPQEQNLLATGHYPETLEALAPPFLARIPPDPVNGGPLLYRRDDPDRFTLYSVGLNGQDDGGVASVPARGSFGAPAPAGDWVWRSHPVEAATTP